MEVGCRLKIFIYRYIIGYIQQEFAKVIMKVSFLVTYYNQASYVRKSLDSILAIYKPCDWEIIVGDDGSSDNTRDIVQEYIDKDSEHISMYVMERDGKNEIQVVKRSSLNRINILSKARGDYFCFLDGDDWYCDSQFVEEGIKILSNNPTISIVAFGYQTVFENGSIGERVTLDSGRIPAGIYLRSKYIPAGACLFRMLPHSEIDKLLRVGFYDDNDIVIENFNIGNMYAVNKVIYSYRQTENSTYNSMDEVEKALLNVQGYDADVLLCSQYKKDLISRYSAAILTLYIYRNNLSSFNKHKLELYYNASLSIPESLIVNFLRLYTEVCKGIEVNNSNKVVRKEVKKAVNTAIWAHPKFWIKENIKKIIRK